MSHKMSVIKPPEGSWLAGRRWTLWGDAKGLYRPIFLTPTEATVVGPPSLKRLHYSQSAGHSIKPKLVIVQTLSSSPVFRHLMRFEQIY